MMLVVLAHESDEAAAGLVAHWRDGGRDAGMLTLCDLSRRGWVYDPERPSQGRAVVDGRVLPVTEIAMIVTRLAGVLPQDLPWIHEQDREYAASEMYAFLQAWLTSLPCPVLNRPSAGALAGPAWRPEEWLWRARRLGLRSAPMRRSAVRPGDGEPRSVADDKQSLGCTVSVDVVRERVIVDGRDAAPEHRTLAAAAQRLARDAGTELLHVELTMEDSAEPCVTSACPWVNLSHDAVVEALAPVLPGEPAPTSPPLQEGPAMEVP